MRLVVCPLLTAIDEPGCTAVAPPIRPTVYQRERYCQDDYERCPTRLRTLELARRISIDEYLAIWLAPTAHDQR